MPDGEWPNVVAMLLDQCAARGEAPFLWAKHEGRYRPISWADTAGAVARLANVLRGAGVVSGERVAIVSENRPEWLIADFAIMAAGGITVPVYTTNTEADHRHIFDNSGARGVIVSSRRLAARLLPVAHESDSLDFVIAMEDPGLAQKLNFDLLLWDRALAEASGDITELRQRIKPIGRHTTACIVYTSGTGGAPRGVMLDHGALLHNSAGAADVLAEIGIGDDVFLSFLPLSHAYEHVGGELLPIYVGAQIYYAEGVEKLATNMVEARPTVMTVVPRLFELLRGRILRAVEEQGGVAKGLFDHALLLGTKRYHNPESLNLAERIEDRFLTLLVRRKVRARFGGRVKALVSGGAPLTPEVGVFFKALGLLLIQGYGQTEAAPVISVNRPLDVHMDTVGPPLKNTEVRIADDGEILVRGDLVMQGYWGDAEATARVLRDGWLHTGDIGEIGANGHLRITDRKKDIIVSDKGDNVSPQRIEGMLTLEPEIAQAMIYGDRKPYLVGLLVPDAEWLKRWARQNSGAPGPENLTGNAALHKALGAAVSRLNGRLSNLERIRRFTIAAEPFSVDNGEMTPTMKIKRHIIVEHYGAALESLYQGKTD